MDSLPSTMAILVLLLLLLILMFTSSSWGHDMSIISYDETHLDDKSTTSIWRTNGEVVMALYEEWLLKHGKAYNSLGEKQRRFAIFKDNLRFIHQHNANQSHGYKVGLNRFADLSLQEYRAAYLGIMKPNTNSKQVSNSKRSDRYAPRHGEDQLPDSIDWREFGAVAPVKDQGSCGSCWAFSTICAVEGINKIVTGDLIVLSEQELVDCDTSYNQGCNGGSTDYAFEFIINNGGIDTQQDYPYRGRDGSCNSLKRTAKVVSIDDYGVVPENDESAMKKAVANQPLSVLIEAGSRSFMLYESGIYDGNCGIALDHGVAIVGYGTENGKDYWIVRNSWGKNWGEGGYIRMERNLGDSAPTGKCGIAMHPIYAIKTGQNPQTLSGPIMEM